MPINRSCLLFSIIIFLSQGCGAQPEKELFWTSKRGIHRAPIGDSTVTDIAQVKIGQPKDIVLDVKAEKIYWTDRVTHKINRSNMDGSDLEVLVEAKGFPHAISLHLEEKKMYWINALEGEIMRANLDGSMVETVGNTTTSNLSIFDFNARKLYAYKNESLHINSLNGSAKDSVDLGKTFKSLGMAFSERNNTIFWTTYGKSHNMLNYNGSYSVIWRSSLDGSGLKATNVRRFFKYGGIALDERNGKMYWTGWRSSSPKMTGKIFRSNFDGTDEEDLVTYTANIATYPSGIALDLENGKMYWTDLGAKKIMRANLDGSDVATLIEPDLEIPYAIALDTLANKIYWVNASPTGADRVQRSNIDGTEVQILVTQDQVNPQGITLDLNKQMMYWVNSNFIHRAKLDGTEVENLVQYRSSERPNGLALDLENGKMYWTLNSYTEAYILRSNLDGSNIEELVTLDYRRLKAIVLDVSNREMYWTSNNLIQRANLDGSEVEDFISQDGSSLVGLALDLQTRKVYWADEKLNKIRRANLDGSGVEDVMDVYMPGWLILR